MAVPSSLQSFSQFLRLPQILETMFTRVRSEPIVNYSHLQILTSNDHVQKLRTILDKKLMAEKNRVAKQKKKETYKSKES